MVLLALSAAVLITLAACQNPFANLSQSGPKTVISVKLHATSSAVSGLLQRLSMKQQAAARAKARRTAAAMLASAQNAKGVRQRRAQGAKLMMTTRTTPLSKAYLGADKVHFTLLNSSGQIVTNWDYAPSSTIDAFSQGSGNDNEIGLTVTQPIPTGVYTLKADIYNNQTSAISPVVSGAGLVTVTPNATSQATVTCLPISPQTLTLGTPANVPLAPWVFNQGDGNWSVQSTGAESWYQVSLTAGDYEAMVTAEPYDAYAVVFDSYGNLVTAGGATENLGGSQALFTVVTAGTYYVGVLGFSTSSEDNSTGK